MTPVLDVGFDGTHIEEADRLREASVSWRLAVAATVSAGLAVAVLVWVVVPKLARAPQSQQPTDITERTTSEAIVDAASGALRAWGRFASTGCLSQLEPWFDREGPQYRQLVVESISSVVVDGPAYQVGFHDGVVEQRETTSAVVAATVEWHRTGEATQRYRWEIALRGEDGAWQVWSVRTAR